MIPRELVDGVAHPFADWANSSVPKGPPGVYTIWRCDEFLYVGISWREPSATASSPTKGLWGRLDSHASGRRASDQFCIYISDRFVLGNLDRSTITAIAAGEQSLDRLTRDYIHQHLSYRYVVTATGAEARKLEQQIRGEGLEHHGLPFLNPSVRTKPA